MARTIDNLGIEASIQYAEGLKNPFIDQIKQAGGPAKQAEVDTLSAVYTSELTQLLGTNRQRQTYAAFSPPENYNSQKGRLFTHQVIPCFAGEERKEMIITRIEGVQASTSDPATSKEATALIELLNELSDLDKDLDHVNGSRMQLQKG